jgi:hypothetical protein
MNRSVTQALAGCALAAAFAATTPSYSIAGVPSPTNSTLPACMVLCPMGDIGFTVTIRDLANNPVAGASVVISFDFGACENNVFICEQLPSDPYLVNAPALTIRMFTDANGNVTFPARVGGTAPEGCVGVFANGVLMRTYALASPDQNGNGVVAPLVGASDWTTFLAKLGVADPTADLDCSGGPVDAADTTVLGAHFGHSCVGIVDPALRRTWGSLKLHYR